jgi:hypothetical protein
VYKGGDLMIPDIDVLTENLDELDYPNRTYNVEFYLDGDSNIQGFIDEEDSIKQAAYLILNTERYVFPIYSWGYGVELVDLIGQPIPYVISELERRIEEALTQDNRIEGVKDFRYELGKNKIHCDFTIIAKTGDIPSDLEVDI